MPDRRLSVKIVTKGDIYSVSFLVGKKVKYKITQRRPGDVATCYADPSKAIIELNWEAEKTLEDMCKDSWNYIEKKNGNV